MAHKHLAQQIIAAALSCAAFTAGTSYADCTPTAISTGDTVNCDGTVSDFIVISGHNDVTLNILENATAEGAIKIANSDGLTIHNLGTVSSDAATTSAIGAGGSSLGPDGVITIINHETGLIQAPENADSAQAVYTNGFANTVIENAGEITSYTAINTYGNQKPGSNGTILNDDTGIISGAEAITIGGYGAMVLHNTGSIIGEIAAITLDGSVSDSTMSITNLEGGTIAGAIVVENGHNTIIDNAGDITGLGAAIKASGKTTYSATETAPHFSLTNQATGFMDGHVAVSIDGYETVDIDNYGTIRAEDAVIDVIGTGKGIGMVVVNNHTDGVIEQYATEDGGVSIQEVGTVILNNDGRITSTRPKFIDGNAANVASVPSLPVFTNLNASVTHNNTGAIEAIGNNLVTGSRLSAGLFAALNDEYMVHNTGSISAEGGQQNYGINSISNGSLELVNGVAGEGVDSGVVMGVSSILNDTAGNATDQVSTSVAILIEHGDDIESDIVNFGTLDGDYAILAVREPGSAIFTNPTYNSIERVTNFGVLHGDVFLGANDDSFTQDLSLGTVSSEDVIDGGEGNDAFTVQGAGTYSMDTGHVVNFETFDVLAGADVTFADGSTHVFSQFSTIGEGSILRAANTQLVSNFITNAGLLDLQNDGNGTHVTHFNGHYTQTATGTLQLDLGASNGINDVLAVTNNVILSGVLAVTGNGQYYTGDMFDIITSGTRHEIAGEFDVEDLPEGYTWDVIYADYYVRLVVLASQYMRNTCGDTNNQNQVRVCNAIYSSTTLTDIQDVLGGLSGTDSHHALQSLHAESYHGSREMARNAADNFMGLMRDRIGEQHEMVVLPKEQKDIDVWARAYGNALDRGTDTAEYMGYEIEQYGFAAGLDKRVNDALQLGVSVGYSNATLDYDGGYASSEMDGLQLGVYGTYMKEDWHVDAMLGYGRHDASTTRHTGPANNHLVARSEYDLDVFSAQIEAGRDYKINEDIEIEPFAQLSYHHVRSDDDIQESGAGLADLEIQKVGADFLTSRIGMRLSHQKTYDNMDARVQLRADWEHDYINDQRIDARFIADRSNTAFYSEGQNLPKDRFTIGLGGTAFLKESGINLYAHYDYAFADDYQDHRASAGVKIPLQKELWRKNGKGVPTDEWLTNTLPGVE